MFSCIQHVRLIQKNDTVHNISKIKYRNIEALNWLLECKKSSYNLQLKPTTNYHISLNSSPRLCPSSFVAPFGSSSSSSSSLCLDPLGTSVPVLVIVIYCRSNSIHHGPLVIILKLRRDTLHCPFRGGMNTLHGNGIYIKHLLQQLVGPSRKL